MRVCTKERKGVTAAVLMATPCTNSLGGESGGHKMNDPSMMMMSHDDDVPFSFSEMMMMMMMFNR